ncbi:hypothetical protein [Bacillus sp. Marseille-P3800]|uniref:hypothetical protein n=1 Tax=Bacillus sp. Marseille-P3800 TaxID=2014782 RepID=UPI000C06CC24|nr:hypothetical protein [Bacillus sp. Marseille-P3800]
MKPYDDSPNVFPGFDFGETDDSFEHSIRFYIYLRLTRDYLHNIADQNQIPLAKYQRIIAAITNDLQASRKYLSSINVKVATEPEPGDDILIRWRWWKGSQTSSIGGTKNVLKAEIKETLDYYFKNN